VIRRPPIGWQFGQIRSKMRPERDKGHIANSGNVDDGTKGLGIWAEFFPVDKAKNKKDNIKEGFRRQANPKPEDLINPVG
jgi:hypothetical protein